MGAELAVAARQLLIVIFLGLLLLLAALLGLSVGSSGWHPGEILALFTGSGEPGAVAGTILREIRLPRIILAAAAGSTLALGGLVFQALLRNPLAEPYILGISGGSAIGAIIGMLAGFSLFPGIAGAAFFGSMLVLAILLFAVAGRSSVRSNTLLLGGVMLNAFCGAVIMFLISITQTSEVHQILFWLMGDFTMSTRERLPMLAAVLPCFIVIMVLARPLNLLLLGQETAAAMGINVRQISLILLLVTTFMVSIIVCNSGLIGFVGLVTPHVFRLLFGPDHRLLVPACILGGGAYMIFCDVLARTLPAAGEMPVGIITAMLGAPLFIFLLWRARP